MACNGMGMLRDPKPTDRAGGEILQCDPKTGKTIKRYSPPWPGGMHGVTWHEKTQTLWVTALAINALAEVDPKDNFRILREIPVTLGRAHGVDFEGDAMVHVFRRSADSEGGYENGEDAGCDPAFEGRS